MLNTQGKAGLEETHPVCRLKSRHLVVHCIQNAVVFGHHFMHSLGRVQRWHVARLAPTQSSGKSRERVGERAGRLPRVWKLEWSRVWLPGGVQVNADVSRCREGVDISLLNVRALGLRPPPVGQVHQLPCEKRAAIASSSRKR